MNIYQQQTRQKSQPQRAQRVRHLVCKLPVSDVLQQNISGQGWGREGFGCRIPEHLRACWTRVNCSNYFWLLILLEGVLGFWRVYLNCGCFFFSNLWLWAVCQRMSTCLKGRINPKLEAKFWPGTQLVTLRVCILDWGQGNVRVRWTLKSRVSAFTSHWVPCSFPCCLVGMSWETRASVGFFFPLRQPLLHSLTDLTLTFFEALID